MDLKELITAELKKQGLSEDLHTKITVKEESEISGAVATYIKENPPKKLTFAELVKEQGMETELAAMIQSETDKRVTQALDTQKKKMEDDAAGKTKIQSTTPELDILREQISKLTDVVTNQQETQKKGEVMAKVKQIVEDNKLPESWASRINVTDEAEIEGAVKKLVTEHTEIKQKAIAAEIGEEYVPGASKNKTTVFESTVDDFKKNLDGSAANIQVVEID